MENGRYLASQIPGAKYVEYEDGAHGFLEGDVPKLCGEIEEFVTGKREIELPDLERVLATVLFTDIVVPERYRQKACQSRPRVFIN